MPPNRRPGSGPGATLVILHALPLRLSGTASINSSPTRVQFGDNSIGARVLRFSSISAVLALSYRSGIHGCSIPKVAR